MKQPLAIGWMVVALCASLIFAGGVSSQPVTQADAIPAYEVVDTVRSMGLTVTGRAERQGPYYVLQAADRRGNAMRVVADAQSGDVVSISRAPVANAAVTNYQRGPRIIQVPQFGERQPSVSDPDDEDVSNNDDEEVVPPPRPRFAPATHVAPPPRTTPRWPPQREAVPPPKPVRQIDMSKPRIGVAPVTRPAPPQPPASRRAVLSAPPPPAEGPTPIKPTPKFDTKIGAKAEAGEKFAAPREATVTQESPPAGYTPPAALPRDADGDSTK